MILSIKEDAHVICCVGCAQCYRPLMLSNEIRPGMIGWGGLKRVQITATSR